MIDEVMAFEKRVWQALQHGDREADAALLDPGFLGVYPDGFANRADHLAQLDQGGSMDHWALSDARCLDLGAGLALLSYRADFRRRGAETSETMYVSSLWRRRGDGWVNLFSQDTPAQ